MTVVKSIVFFVALGYTLYVLDIKFLNLIRILLFNAGKLKGVDGIAFKIKGEETETNVKVPSDNGIQPWLMALLWTVFYALCVYTKSPLYIFN